MRTRDGKQKKKIKLAPHLHSQERHGAPPPAPRGLALLLLPAAALLSSRSCQTSTSPPKAGAAPPLLPELLPVASSTRLSKRMGWPASTLTRSCLPR